MLLELTHVFLFAVCWTLALLLTFRLSFPSPITLMSLRIGLILVLADDVIAFTAEFGISVPGRWASAAGAMGAVLICVCLFRLLLAFRAGKWHWRGLRAQNRGVAADTWII
jgi:hypothetical protein